MSLLEDARRLAEYTNRQPRMICMTCQQPFAEGERGHASDCPYLALPRIVAALEAAERVRDAWGTTDDFVEPMEALVAALIEPEA